MKADKCPSNICKYSAYQLVSDLVFHFSFRVGLSDVEILTRSVARKYGNRDPRVTGEYGLSVSIEAAYLALSSLPKQIRKLHRLVG